MRMSKSVNFPIANENVAGIDIGSKEHYVCVGEDTNCDVRSFSSYTSSLYEMVKWLKSRQVQKVAMESTGVYWRIPFALLQDNGFDVILVNSSHTKNVSGKKTDMKDCQWIWKLHSAGLLHGSFQPDGYTERLRVYSRRRRSLIRDASRCVNQMQKVLTLMNLHLPLVLSDITGKSGQAIIRAILDGERCAKVLAGLVDYRVKATQEEIAEALTGFWRDSLVFELKQCWDSYHFHQVQIDACDQQIESILQEQAQAHHVDGVVYDPAVKTRIRKNDPLPSIDRLAYQLSGGVDLLTIDGVGRSLLLSVLSETGLDLPSKFLTYKHYVSWLGLCPNKKVSGGKVLSSKTPKTKNACAQAYRQAALNVAKKRGTVLANFYQRIAYRSGKKAAITATARKIAIIVYKMLETKEPYSPQDLAEHQEHLRQRRIRSIKKAMRQLEIGIADLEAA